MSVLVGIGSIKGSPGVTTVALGLTAVWPGRSALLVEADPSGGDVSVWYRTGEDPGLVSLAAAARRTPSTGTASAGVNVLEHAHDLGNGMFVVPGPLGADQAHAAVSLLSTRQGLFRRAVGSGAGVDVVIVDVGRLDPVSPALGLLGDLDVLLVAGQGDVRGLAHLAARAPALADSAGGPVVAAVLTRGCRYRRREVEDVVGVPLLAALPEDGPTVAVLTGAPAGTRVGRRGHSWESGPLMVALRRLAGHLADRIASHLTDRPAGLEAPPRSTTGGPAALTAPPGPATTTGSAAGSAAGSLWIRPAGALAHVPEMNQ